MLPESFHFIRPLWLLSLPLLAAVWWASLGANDPLRGWRSSVAPALLKALRTGESKPLLLRHALLLAGWILAAVAVAGPTWKPEPSPFADDPVPVMVLLKSDSSMLTEDLAPSRMERARLEIVDLADSRRGQPMGLIAYSGTAHLVLPPTRDTSVVAAMAAEISPEIMPDQGRTEGGANLSEALQVAVEAMGSIQGPIVIVADSLRESDAIDSFRRDHPNPIVILRTARVGMDQDGEFQMSAKQLSARVVPLTPDDSDTQQIIRSVASAPVAVSQAGSTPRWQEAGWWLCPILLVMCAFSFRRRTSSLVRSNP